MHWIGSTSSGRKIPQSNLIRWWKNLYFEAGHFGTNRGTSRPTSAQQLPASLSKLLHTAPNASQTDGTDWSRPLASFLLYSSFGVSFGIFIISCARFFPRDFVDAPRDTTTQSSSCCCSVKTYFSNTSLTPKPIGLYINRNPNQTDLSDPLFCAF